HGHADHFFGLELLHGDLRSWARQSADRSPRLRVHGLPDTFERTIGAHFAYMTPQIDHSPAEPGRPFVLWQDGPARLEVTPLEVQHFQQSTVNAFSFRNGQGGEAQVVCLFDFGDFHAPDSPQAQRGGRPDHPLLQEPDLLVAESTTWADPRHTM